MSIVEKSFHQITKNPILAHEDVEPKARNLSIERNAAIVWQPFKFYVGSKQVKLPPAKAESTSLFSLLERRRSLRSFSAKPLSLEELSTLLYYSSGVTDSRDGWPLTTSPSAGSFHLVETYAICLDVESVDIGAYHYYPPLHSLHLMRKMTREDFINTIVSKSITTRMKLPELPTLQTVPLALVLTASYSRLTRPLLERTYRYVHIEAGCIGQNVLLLSEALGKDVADFVGGTEVFRLVDKRPRHFLFGRATEQH